MYHVLVQNLLQPYTLLLLLVGLALANLWRKRRETRRRLLAVTIAYLLLLALSLRVVSYPVIGSLEWQYPPLRERPADTQAIVVLSSFVNLPNAIRLRPELDEFALQRCIVAAQMYRVGPSCPILVTGNGTDLANPSLSCSQVMGDFLVHLGVRASDVIVENNSGSTFENAVESRKLLNELGLRRILLVTDANHLPRAVKCFQKQGLDVTPCGTFYRATGLDGSVEEFVPSLNSIRDVELAFHEWLGLVWYWLRGRI